MGRRSQLRLGHLGQASPSLLDWLTQPFLVTAGQSGVATYNATVAAQEAAKNPTNRPIASTSDLQGALNTAQANGVDPSIINSLWMAGADAVQLQIAASSPTQAAAAIAPGGALQSLTGVTPVAGQPVSSSLLYPSAAIPQLQTYGPLSPDQIASIANVTQAGAGAGDWVSANWPWLALGALGVFWLLKG